MTARALVTALFFLSRAVAGSPRIAANVPSVSVARGANQSLFIDIHLPVLGTAREAVVAANVFLNAKLGNNEVDFQSKDTPHVTLYLTEFSCPDADSASITSRPSSGLPLSNPAPPLTCEGRIVNAVSGVLSALQPPHGPCEIALSSPYAAGTYAMMNVTNSACLQRYSDLLVNTTHQFSRPNQTAPSWVNTLPEPERSEKLRLIKEYGSPNVFSQFSPHVTLAWASDPAAVAGAIRLLEVNRTSFTGQVVAFGSVGDHGTVLQGKDLATFNISDSRDACRTRHKTEPACDADRVTSGGCVWCDIVDSPAFCTTESNARGFQPPPQGRPFMCNWPPSVAAAPSSAHAEGISDESDTDYEVFSQETDGYHTFRIPSLAATTNGSLIAVAEGRVRKDGPQVNCGGWTNNTCCYGPPASDYDHQCYDKDIVVKVSTDHGKSWGTAFSLTRSNRTHFFTDGVSLVDPATKRVWIQYSVCPVTDGYNGCIDRYVVSDNHGGSWKHMPGLDLFATRGAAGVGSGIALRRGPQAGRLVFTKGIMVFSDDHGTTWQGGKAGIGSNEEQIAEMSDGTLISASRSGYSPRIFTSRDQGATWDKGYQLDGTDGHANVTTDNCALSFISTADGTTVMLSHPNRPDIHQMRPQPIGRQNVTVTTARYNASTGQLAGWEDYLQVYPGPSAYTSLALLGQGTCGVLYERSPIGELPVFFTSINLRTFPCPT